MTTSLLVVLHTFLFVFYVRLSFFCTLVHLTFIVSLLYFLYLVCPLSPYHHITTFCVIIIVYSVAQLCLSRPESEYIEGAKDEMVQAAISAYCRELYQISTIGAPIFSTIARNEIQYSVESVDSFHKYVYDDVVEVNTKKKDPEQTMTKSEAMKILGLLNEGSSASVSKRDEISKSDIKQSYKKLAFNLHPDRFAGSTEECEEARNQFGRVKLAYDTLSSGVRGEEGISWYESLGGKERTGLVGPINLLPLTVAHEYMKRHDAEGACLPLDPSMVQSFVARHLRSA